MLWKAILKPHHIWIEESQWYGEGGEEMSAGGFYRESKRWRELNLFGPYGIDRIMIKLKPRKLDFDSVYRCPAGLVAHFVLKKGVS
jgi:hypothetical protein